MRRLYFFILIVLLPSAICFAQNSSGYTLKQFSTENGLPSNGIKGLQWDERTKFLWIATEAGIVRYNGSEFKTFTKENTPFIASERTVFMIRNNSGEIYTSDLSNNLIRINKNKLSLWRSAKDIRPAGKGVYLISVSDSFFSKKSHIDDPGSFSTSFIRLATLSDTSCMILFQAMLYYYSISMHSPVFYETGIKRVRNIFKIGKSCFVVDSANRIQLLNLETKISTPFNIRFSDKRITIDKNANSGIYWSPGMENPLLFDNGNAWIISFDGKEIIATHLLSNIPPDTYIRFAQYSKQLNTLFIGTDSKGLIVFYPKRVESRKRKQETSTTRNSYYSQIELSNGNILTNESDIIGDALNNDADVPIKGKFTYFTYLMNDTLLWYAKNSNGLNYSVIHNYNYKTGKENAFLKARFGDGAFASVGNKLYFVTDGGIGFFDRDSLFYTYRYSQSSPGNLFFNMVETEPGILSIAGCDGFLQYDIGKNKLDTVYSKPSYCVRSVWKYKDYVFFGTYGDGFYISKQGKIKRMPLDKNNYLLYTHCFVPDDKGFCWMSTNRGLFKASIDDLIYAYENNDPNVYYYYFGKNDGMEMTELNGGCSPCALLMKNKTISFPTMDGLLWVHPDRSESVLPDGEIFIDEISVDDERYNADSIHLKNLPAKSGEIIVRLGVPAWCNKENLYIDYRINDEQEWRSVDVEKGMEIHFNNLAPGKYKLIIRKRNGFGNNNYSYKEIEFYIRIPWFKQWWFNVLMLGLLAMLFMWYYNVRTRQLRIKQEKLEMQVAEKTKELQQKTEVLEKNDTIKTRLISIISHDIVTPLKFITVAGKNLVDKRKMMTEEMQDETIQEMVNTTQELQLLSTNILNWIKYQNENRRLAKETFNLREMVSQVLGLLQSLAKQKSNTIHNKVEADLEIYQLYEPVKILVYNLLTNSINFTEKGNIYVEAVETNDAIIISVKDEGIGMTQEQIQRLLADEVVITAANVDNKKGHGLGYLIIKDLVKTMGATLQIESEKGKGTKVSVYFPINHTS